MYISYIMVANPHSIVVPIFNLLMNTFKPDRYRFKKIHQWHSSSSFESRYNDDLPPKPNPAMVAMEVPTSDLRVFVGRKNETDSPKSTHHQGREFHLVANLDLLKMPGKNITILSNKGWLCSQWWIPWDGIRFQKFTNSTNPRNSNWTNKRERISNGSSSLRLGVDFAFA